MSVRDVRNCPFVKIVTGYGLPWEKGNRSAVVQEVVEVRVGDGIAGLGPDEKCTPSVLEKGVDAAVRGSAPCRSARYSSCDAPRPVA